MAQQRDQETERQGLDHLWVDWRVPPADHAWLGAKITFRRQAAKKRARRWAPRDPEAASADAENFFEHFDSIDELHCKILEFQDKHKLQESAVARRRARVPLQAREMYRQAAESPAGPHADELRKQAWVVIVWQKRSELLTEDRNRLKKG